MSLYSDRKQKLKSAEKSAKEPIEVTDAVNGLDAPDEQAQAYRREMETKFESQSTKESGSTDEFQKQLDEETGAKLASMQVGHAALHQHRHGPHDLY